MALTFFWRVSTDSPSAPTDFVSGMTGSISALGTPSFPSSPSRNANTAGYYPATTDCHQFNAVNLVYRAEGCMAFWLYTHQWNDLSRWLRVWDGVNTNNGFNLRPLNSGGTNLRWILGKDGLTPMNITTTYGSFAVNTWYFIVLRWKYATNDAEIVVYDNAGTQLTQRDSWDIDAVNGWTSTQYPPNELGGTNTFLIPKPSGADAADISIQNLFLGNSWDDATVFHTNRDITTYASYDAGSSAAVRLIRPKVGSIGTGNGFGMSRF